MSGPSNPQNMTFTRRTTLIIFSSFGGPRFGCTDTQVHRNTVARQLHMISKIDLVSGQVHCNASTEPNAREVRNVLLNEVVG